MKEKSWGKDLEYMEILKILLFLAKDVAEWINYAKMKNGTYNVTQMLSSIDEDESWYIKFIYQVKTVICGS